LRNLAVLRPVPPVHDGNLDVRGTRGGEVVEPCERRGAGIARGGGEPDDTATLSTARQIEEGTERLPLRITGAADQDENTGGAVAPPARVVLLDERPRATRSMPLPARERLRRRPLGFLGDLHLDQLSSRATALAEHWRPAGM